MILNGSPVETVLQLRVATSLQPAPAFFLPASDGLERAVRPRAAGGRPEPGGASFAVSWWLHCR